MPDSSTETAVEQTDTTTTDVNAAESSEAGKVQGVGSYEDAVNAALGEGPEATPVSDEQGSKEPAPVLPEAKPADTEVSEEELAKYSKNVQDRIRRLVEVRKAAEAEVEPLRQEIETMKPKAERLDELTGYMRQHEITPDHLNNALGLTAMINRGNYREALPVLERLINDVRMRAGEVLPDDLQQRVNLGYITEADAKALHQAKTAEKQTADQAKKEREKVETERAQREVNAVVDTAVTTADTWHQEQATTDPDWNLKRDLVTQRMELELLRVGPKGYPRTKQAVRDLLDRVKKDVEAGIKNFQPTPKAITPIHGNGASPRSAAKPSSMFDAVEQGLAKAHGG